MQKQFPEGFVLDLHYWGNKGSRILQTYNIDQLPDQYLAVGTTLKAQVPNPFYGNPAASGVWLNQRSPCSNRCFRSRSTPQ